MSDFGRETSWCVYFYRKLGQIYDQAVLEGFCKTPQVFPLLFLIPH